MAPAAGGNFASLQDFSIGRSPKLLILGGLGQPYRLPTSGRSALTPRDRSFYAKQQMGRADGENPGRQGRRRHGPIQPRSAGPINANPSVMRSVPPILLLTTSAIPAGRPPESSGEFSPKRCSITRFYAPCGGSRCLNLCLDSTPLSQRPVMIRSINCFTLGTKPLE